MSNTARKARKAAGIKFVHATKTATPLRERIGFAFMQPKKAADQVLLRGGTTEEAQAVDAELRATRAARRLQRRLAGVR